jgi:leader peptidase (prepilin peptidase) / N-methyltransferase
MGVALAALAGFLAGALLPNPVYRYAVPADQEPRTMCDHCGRSLAWRSHCPQCAHAWGPPWWATALVAGAAAAALVWAVGPTPELPLYVALAVYGTGLGAVDLICHRLPTMLVYAGLAVGLLGFTAVAAGTGEWGALGRAVLGSAALAAVFLALYLVPGQNLGFGDVRLAGLLGLFLGWLGWPAVIWGALLPWLVNAPVTLGLLLARRVHRKSRLPFGPAMLAGAVLATLVAALRV